MGQQSYANLEVFENNTSNGVDIVFNFKPRKVIITNDSSSGVLGFRFNLTNSFATLQPTETITLEMSSRTIFLSGGNIDYRVWGMG